MTKTNNKIMKQYERERRISNEDSIENNEKPQFPPFERLKNNSI